LPLACRICSICCSWSTPCSTATARASSIAT
jgi:hypothetical protein